MRNVSSLGRVGAGVIALCAIRILASCSPSAGQTGASEGPGGVGGNNGTGNTGGSLFGSGSTTSNGGDNGLGATTGTGSFTSRDAGANCNVEVHAGERQPLDMYFILDKSGSMNEKVTGGTKWSAITTVLINFLNDPN
jgi:hypothetical protein